MHGGRGAVRVVMAIVAVITAGGAVAGCGAGQAPIPVVGKAPADLILDPGGLPTGFTPSPLTVDQLVAADAASLKAAANTTIVPEQCRPTADAALQPQLSGTDAAVLAATSGTGTLVELVTTAERDIAADVVATTGRCARTETTIVDGNMAGTRVTTEYTTLDDPDLAEHRDAVERMHLVASAITTTLPDGGRQSRISYAGYALVQRPGKNVVTVQLTVSGEPTAATAPDAAAPAARAPMPAEDFVVLFGDAVRAAADRS
ncbi:hypothetical protein [Gordonia desulfuricans]|uniref:hypothetical protein n=1 Tax=Gordonia desulfuricans TaxID=89051 RepID=UPI00192EDED9|nr:hypothetical protein [Gordonia desulfuricans]